jgi:hypothetical protein
MRLSPAPPDQCLDHSYKIMSLLQYILYQSILVPIILMGSGLRFCTVQVLSIIDLLGFYCFVSASYWKRGSFRDPHVRIWSVA